MHWVLRAGGTAAAILAGVAAADAQTVRANEHYCLQTSDPDSAQGGPLCRYETRAQCEASKTGPTDFCFPNPALRGRN